VRAIVLGALLSAPAWAQEPDEALSERIRGEDIAAWEALEGAERPPSTDDLLAFVLEFRDSPLAELAWAEVRARGEVDPAFVRAHRLLVLDLDRSLQSHTASLSREPATVAVAPITASEEEDAPPPEWFGQALVGGLVDDAGPAVSLGVSAGRGPLSGVLRGQVGSRLNAELAVHWQPAVFGVAFLEAGADARLRGIARGGVAVPLGGRVALQSSMALAVGPDGLAPVVRLELTGTTGLSRATRRR